MCKVEVVSYRKAKYTVNGKPASSQGMVARMMASEGCKRGHFTIVQDIRNMLRRGDTTTTIEGFKVCLIGHESVEVPYLAPVSVGMRQAAKRRAKKAKEEQPLVLEPPLPVDQVKPLHQ